MSLKIRKIVRYIDETYIGSGRPHHRIGNRYLDMEEMQVDQTGKAV